VRSTLGRGKKKRGGKPFNDVELYRAKVKEHHRKAKKKPGKKVPEH